MEIAPFHGKFGFKNHLSRDVSSSAHKSTKNTDSMSG